MQVAIIMGSTSDLGKVEPAIEILKSYGVRVKVRCLSAHRAHLGLSALSKSVMKMIPKSSLPLLEWQQLYRVWWPVRRSCL